MKHPIRKSLIVLVFYFAPLVFKRMCELDDARVAAYEQTKAEAQAKAGAGLADKISIKNNNRYILPEASYSDKLAALEKLGLYKPAGGD